MTDKELTHKLALDNYRLKTLMETLWKCPHARKQILEDYEPYCLVPHRILTRINEELSALTTHTVYL